jgi:Zn-dependent protease with chaperone function
MRVMKKTLASALSLSLIILSPGLASWAAAANIATGSAGARVSAAPLALPSVGAVSVPHASFNTPALNAGVSLPGALSLPSASAPSARAAAAASAASAPAIQEAGAVKAGLAVGPKALVPSGAAGAQAPRQGSLQDLVSHQADLSLTGEQAAKMGAGQARDTGAAIMDRVLGLETAKVSGSAVEAAPVQGGLSSSLSPASPRGGGGSMQPPAPPSKNGRGGNNGNGPRGTGSKILGVAASVGRMALAAGVVIGLQAAGVALLPAIFGLTPVAAVWAVSSGLLLLPAALFARYRLGLRDSPRLTKVKWLLDGAIGAFLGAAAVAFPAAGVVLATQGASIGLPLAAAAGAGSLISMFSGSNLVDMLATGTALAALPLLIGVGAGAIGIAPLIGLMALPVMTTITFFLGQIIGSAETGRPFSVPGSLQKFRFPAFNWVMIGVVFALTTGFSAVHANIAFLIWQFTSGAGMPKWDKKLPVTKNLLGLVMNFNVLYLGLLAFTAATAFHSPYTFLVLAFAGERAAVWTEGLLSKLLPASQAAPSTAPAVESRSLDERVERKWPNGYHWAKTGLMIATMAGMAFGMGYWIVGIGSLLKNFAFAAVLATLPLLLSKTLIKAVMKLKPATEQSDPEFYAIMKEMRATINAKRAKKGKAPINLPELTVAPTDIPNAAATGLSPNKSLVFVTQGIKTMLLDPEELRDGLVRLLAGFNESSDEFKVFRMGLLGSVPGVTVNSTPQEAAQAVLRASPDQLHALGTRLLRGVLSHEFSHVMDRHMITGTIGGAISSGVAFASYGVMWAVGHAKVMTQKLKDRVMGNAPKLRDNEADENRPGLTDRPGRGAKPQMLEPLSTGVVLKSLPALLRMFAALWAPIILQITQMAGSRNNEAQADEDGALLSQDPAALALALGLLTTWRPKAFTISGLQLPKLAAVAHMMTVNPLAQLRDAGALPKNDAVDRPPTAADNFMLELFLTHPDTLWRIRTLKKMADALGQDKTPPANGPPPSDKGGGGGGPAPLAQAEKTPANGRGLFSAAFGPVRRAWNALFVVLPDPARNREFWKFTLGQALANIGGSFHYSALNKLLAPDPKDSKRVTDNRAINSAAQLGASVLTGPLVDKVQPQKILVWTYFGRALLMAAVPVLFFHGFYFIALFNVAIFAAGFLQATSMTAGSVAFQRILGDDESRYNKANAVFNVVLSVTGVLAPLAAGAFIVAMDARFGFLSGNALCYAVYGALLLGTSLLYMTLRVPRGPPAAGATHATAPRPLGLGARFKELIDGFRLIFKSRFLRLYLLFTTFSVMMADPIVFSALPRYLSDVLHLSSAMQAAAFSWFLSAASLGTAVASFGMMFMRQPKPEPAPEPGRLTKLEKQGRWSSILHGVSWLLYIGMFFAHSLPLSIAFMAVSMVAAAPAMNIWSSLLQKVIGDETPRDMGKVYASLFFYQLAFSIVGSLLFGWMMTHLSTATALLIAGGVMALMALLDIVEPYLVFPLSRAKKDPPAKK